MSGRLQLIEQKLLAISGAKFQNLCDTYLILREDEYSSLNRTGSQLGKQKTIIGTPDSFLRLSENKLAYIEYTTQSTSIVSKIKDDIDKCLDESKTKVNPKHIHKIIVCFNLRLDIKEESTIQEYAIEKKISLELIGIDTIALDIMSKYFLLARDFLEMSIDTGQILPFTTFIKEYNNRANQLSTPLNNIFFHRDEELTKIDTVLNSKDLLIIAGVAGVGKTKIGIQAINLFKEKNKTYKSYVIAKKDVDIYEDLKIQLKNDKDYILLVDDANRQLTNLSQIFGLFKTNRNGNLKIVITVRNYALVDIKKLAFGFDYDSLTISKFSDKEIIEILKSDSFGILNNKYQNKIVQIADGNPRLAIMSARLALKKQLKFLLGDVTDLFENYFTSFSVDFNLFTNKDLLKSLALVSFFFTIDREDKKFIENMLANFNIDYYNFNEAIEELHKRELVEIQYNHIRISEQVMATYFFYIVFIRDGILSFETLLFNYFKTNKYHFKDTIIPANNSFGYDNVLSKIDTVLDNYVGFNNNDDSQLLEFLDIFWFYKPDATLSFFLQKIKKIEEPVNPIFNGYYETNEFVHEREETIDYLSRFFRHNTEAFIPSIELAFEYIRKKPKHLPELIRRIRESLLFDEPDEKYGFKRQSLFLNIITKKVKKNETHYITAFFEIAKTFLKSSFHITHGGRNNSISFYDYPISDSKEIKEIRKTIWETLFFIISNYRNEFLTIIRGYCNQGYRGENPKIIDFDLSLLVPFVEKHLSSNSFKETYIVNLLISFLNRTKGIQNLSYKKLTKKFNTEQYRYFKKIDWNRIRDKDEYDYTDWKKYEKLKEEDLKKNFSFSDTIEFNIFFKTIDNLLSVIEKNNSQVEKSIDVIISENFKKDNNLGIILIEEYLNKNYDLHCLYKTLSTIINTSEERAYQLWNILKESDTNNISHWKLEFFIRVSKEFITEEYYNSLIDTIKNTDINTYFNLENYSNFSIIKNNVIKEIIEVISKKIENENIRLVFSEYPFTNIKVFENDYELIKKTYFQQYILSKSGLSFDYQMKGFKNIYNHYPIFLFDFFSFLYSKYENRRNNDNLKIAFIWEKEKELKNIDNLVNLLIDKEPYIGFGEHPLSSVFSQLNQNQNLKASEYIKYFIKKNSKSENKIEIIFNIIRSYFNSRQEEFLHNFLQINSDVNFFKNIDWVGNAGIQSGEVIWGELYAKKWNKVLDMVNNFNNNLVIIPIRNYIKKKIQTQYRRAEDERKVKFIIPNKR